MPDSTDPAPSDDKPPRKLSAQDKAIQAYIGDADLFLNTAGSDPEIRPHLEARGYGVADFTEGKALLATLRDAFQSRAGGMGKKTLSTAELAKDIATARDEYARFREIARPSFPDRADRLALSLTGDVPEDTGRFLALARASYTAAGLAPHADKAAKRGYSPAVLAPLIAALDSLTGTATDQDEAQGDAIGDTAKRDARCRVRRAAGIHEGTQRRRQRSPPRQSRPPRQTRVLSGFVQPVSGMSPCPPPPAGKGSLGFLDCSTAQG